MHDVCDVADLVTTQVQSCFENPRRVTVKTPLQTVSKFRDTVTGQRNVHLSVLGTYQSPRFQLGQIVFGEIDER